MSLLNKTPLNTFSRLHWRLALGYMGVTVVGVVLLEIVILAVVGWYFFNSDLLPLSLAEEASLQTVSLERRLGAGMPLERAATDWVDEYRQGAVWNIDAGITQVQISSEADKDWLQFGVFRRRGSLRSDSLVDGSYDPGAFVWSSRALALADAAWSSAAREGVYGFDEDGSVMAALPVHDAQGQAIGVVLARSAAFSVGDFVVTTGLELVLPTFLVVTAVAAVLGLVFGLLAARPLTRRLNALTRASDAWSRGDFTAAILDPEDDEIGLVAQRLDHMAGQLQGLVEARQALGMLEERDRIARDLHDTAKQQAFALSSQLAATRNLLEANPTLAAARLQSAEHLADELREELQALIVGLRPPGLRDTDLANAIRSFVENWSTRTRIPTELDLHPLSPLDDEVEQAVYRVLQEALANVARHSQATIVRIAVHANQANLTLEVNDDGRGFSPAATVHGVGLASMHERLSVLGGELLIHAAPGQGTQLLAVVPTGGRDHGRGLEPDHRPPSAQQV